MASTAADWTDELCRPLPIGVGVGHAIGSAGTLGAFVRRRSDPTWVGILSTSTSIAPPGAKKGDYIHQPPRGKGSILTGYSRIARLEEFTALTPVSEARWDAATARLLDGIEIVGNRIPAVEHGIEQLGAPVGPDEIGSGDTVAKLGCATGLTRGVITGAERHEVRVSIGTGQRKLVRFSGLFEVRGEAGPFSGPGDGGAIAYRLSDGRAVGMVFASTAGSEPGETYLIPLMTVFEAFDLELHYQASGATPA